MCSRLRIKSRARLAVAVVHLLRVTLVALAVGLPVLSGCMSAAGNCSLDGVSCARDASGWLIENRDVSGTRVELKLSGGASVTLRNVQVRANDFRLEVSCACAVRGENFTFDGVGPSSNVYLAGPYVAWDTQRAKVANVTLDGLQARGVGRFDVSYIGGWATVANLTLTCSDPYGIDLDALDGTEGFLLSQVATVGCARIGIDSYGRTAAPVGLHLIRSHLNGTGAVDEANTYNDGLSPGGGAVFHAVLVDSSIENTRYAVDVRDDSALSLVRSVLAHNVDAILQSGGAHVTLDHATISDNVYGLRVWDDSPVNATASWFVGNGGRGLGGECGGAISGQWSGVLHGNAFVGNAATIDRLGADARGNYWGSPAGPTPASGCMRASPLGDPVAPGVVVVPFLTSPPTR